MIVYHGDIDTMIGNQRDLSIYESFMVNHYRDSLSIYQSELTSITWYYRNELQWHCQ